MWPGLLTPYDFELAILEHLASKESSIAGRIEGLRVLSREFTGVGSFTNFKCDESRSPQRQVDLDAGINMPGVPNGMGAILFCMGNQPKCLEVYTHGGDYWDGVFEGVSIER